MATRTIDRSQELGQRGVGTGELWAQTKSPELYSELLGLVGTEGAEKEAETTAGFDTGAYVSAPIHHDGLLVGIGRRLVAFYDWLSGPATTERDRVQRKIDEAQRRRWNLCL